MSATERPWHVDGVFIVNHDDRIVTTMPRDMARYDQTRITRAKADAELIVRAVNAFDDLVAALREARKQIDDTLCVRDDHHDACVAVDAVLARAEGKVPW